MTQHQQEPVLACAMDAVPREMRTEHEASIRRIVTSILEVHELPTGYALRLPNENKTLYDCITFISNERLCCPFFHFALEVEPEQGPIWLRLTATSDIKPIIQSELLTLATLQRADTDIQHGESCT